jgi:signal transduction histidine kinase
MLHRTQVRLTLLLALATAAIVAGLVLFQQGEQGRMKRFFASRVEEQDVTFDKLVELKGASLEMFAVDYTYWDEMVRCIAEHDQQWADENIAEALGTYKSDAAWLFDVGRGPVYSAVAEGREALAEYALPDSSFAGLDGQNHFAHFFVPTDAGLMEVRGATVHPSDDPDRQTPVRGYFLAGRLWDAAFLEDLSNVAGGPVQLLGPGVKPSPPDQRTGTIVVSRDLADWRGRTAGAAEARVVSYAVQEFNRSSVRQFHGLLLLSLLILGLVALALAFFVTRPLNLLARSMKDEDAAVIKPLVRSRTEFGRLAALVARFFEQKAELVSEVGQRKRAMEALVQKEDELRRSNQELEQFAYVASHDLQEPLRMVGSYTQLLARRYHGKLDRDADEFIGFAVDGVSRMQRLINDLLQYSRVGTRGRAPEPTDTEAVLGRSLQNLKLALEDNHATVTHEPLPKVMADDRQLEQLFQNLVGNAVKFHGTEPPRVHVRAERSNGSWMFSVKDNGIGLDPQYSDRIFLIFQRLHTREEYAGTGIGLAVCKKIVERHGGRIWVESEPGKGADFRFTLPASDSARPMPEAGRPKHEVQSAA